jgi:hypothetical protein
MSDLHLSSMIGQRLAASAPQALSIIDLSRPIRSERVRGFQPPWRTLFVYQCDRGHTVKIHASSFRGKHAVPSTGAIACPQCEAK